MNAHSYPDFQDINVCSCFGKYNGISVSMLQYWQLHLYHLFCMAKSKTSSIHVLLSIEQASCIRWYISLHWFSPRHLCMYKELAWSEVSFSKLF